MKSWRDLVFVMSVWECRRLSEGIARRRMAAMGWEFWVFFAEDLTPGLGTQTLVGPSLPRSDPFDAAIENQDDCQTPFAEACHRFIAPLYGTTSSG